VALVAAGLSTRLYRPVAALREAIVRFARDGMSTRAPQDGPVEVREIATAFNAMAEELVHQREQQLAFLAAVAHDLKNPLTALKLAATAGLRREDVDPDSRRALALVSRQVDQLDRIVTDLLDATRIEAGQLELRPEIHDLRAVVREAAELFGTASEAHPIRVQLPEGPLLASCDLTRIAQVLNNLVSNAIKYSPRGGPVTIALAARGEFAILSVADRGIGIAAEDRDALFEPFRRMGPSRDVIAGVGLGLSVARRIVEAHGGRIAVESTPGAGATFRVTLPMHAAAQAEASSAPTPA
jgi:signal transduction histidine kinase